MTNLNDTPSGGKLTEADLGRLQAARRLYWHDDCHRRKVDDGSLDASRGIMLAVCVGMMTAIVALLFFIDAWTK